MPKDGRSEARKLYPGPLKCEWDGCGAAAERHHKDGDTFNNVRDNIEFLSNIRSTVRRAPRKYQRCLEGLMAA